MKDNFFTKQISAAIRFLLGCSIIFTMQDSYAYEGVRGTDYNTNSNMCQFSDLKWDPFSSNDDINWELTNTYCAAFIGGYGGAIVAADLATKYIGCKPSPTNGLAMAGLAAEELEDLVPPMIPPIISPALAIRMARKARICGVRVGQAATYSGWCANPATAAIGCPYTAVAGGDATRCCGAVAAYYGAVSTSVAALSIIYGYAKQTFQDARICGHDWNVWTKVKRQSDGTYLEDSNGNVWRKGAYSHSYSKCLRDLFNNPNGSNACGFSNSTRDITNKYYREYLYGGQEYEDNGSDSCSNPPAATWAPQYADARTQFLGYNSDNQRYYMTGPGAAPVFACYRFLSGNRNNPDVINAYECCKKRSQNAVCFENDVKTLAEHDYQHTFCSIGQKCSIYTMVFEAYESRQQPNYACVKTYSSCPYNHPLGGGSELKEYDNNDKSKVKNFCQFMNHCSKIPVLPYVRISNLEGDYISSTCKDMKGDSQNVYTYSADLLPIKARGFSSPMTQCFKETMENIFLNKAGESKCSDSNQIPIDGKCGSDNNSDYIYRAGDDLPNPSFFVKIQNSLRFAIKLALTISVIAFGFNVLMGGGGIPKKMIMPYLLKICLIMFFAVGDGWQFGFMKGLIGTSGFLADFTFRPDNFASQKDANGNTTSIPVANNKLDGCQFPRFNYADKNDTDPNHYAYPPGKEYLRVWDTLDCKIGMALGFGPSVSVPNLVLMILGGLFSGGLGVLFIVAAFSFAFFLISMTIRAMHIFILSITAVIILLYVSPIIITLTVFGRTKSMFDSWWKQIMGFSLQPMILFAYLGILINLYNNVLIGSDVTFTTGDSTYDNALVGSNTAATVDTRAAPRQIHCDGNSSNESIYCIFQISNVTTYDGFELLGIGIPMLTNMNSTKINTIIRVAFLMFIFSYFMDKISALAKELVGGDALPGSWGGNSMKMAGAAYAGLKGVADRGRRAAVKLGGKVGRAGLGLAKDAAGALSEKKRPDEARRNASTLAQQSQNKSQSQAASAANQSASSSSGNSQQSSSTGSATPSAPPAPTTPPIPSAPPKTP